MVGGILGIIACYAMVDRPAGALVLAASALGAVVTSAFKQAVAGRL